MDKIEIAVILLGGVFLTAAIFALFDIAAPASKFGAFGSANDHADFRIYINGGHIDLSADKYMDGPSGSAGGVATAINGLMNLGDQQAGVMGQDPETCGWTDVLAHLHNNDGDVVNNHATGVTWGYFLSTLNISIDQNCITLDSGDQYCTGGGKELRYYVNGKRLISPTLRDYEIHNLDRVLITYGNESESGINAQIASVTDKGRMQPPDRNCGLG